MTLPWYRRLFRPAPTFARPKGRAGARRASRRLRLEELEDRRVPSTLLASSDASGTPGNSNSQTMTPGPSMFSADGRYVVFESEATNLVPGGTPFADQIFRKDLITGNVVQVSVAADGTPANSSSRESSISADGQYVAFSSNASNLVAGITDHLSRIYVKNLQTGVVALASISPAGGPTLNPNSYVPAISADGRYVAFMNCVTILDLDEHNSGNIFRKDLQTGDLVEVSTATDGTQGNHDSNLPSISADGRYVAFRSYATNLGPVVPSGIYNDYRKDLTTGEVDLVVETVGHQAYYYDPSISADGRYVACFDLYSGTTVHHVIRENMDTGAVDTISTDGASAAMSADGRFVVYVSGQDSRLYRKDLQTGDLLDIGVNPPYGFGFEPALSANGDSVAFLDDRINGVLNDPDISQLYVATLSDPYMVTNTSDGGPGSLRKAILNADAATSPVTITFNIPTTDANFVDDDSTLSGGDAAPDVFVIKPTSALPALNNPNAQVTIDGRTQTAFTGDTNPFGPEIVLDGSLAGSASGLTVTSNNNAVLGLDIRSFGGDGIAVAGASGNWVAANYLGTDATGTAVAGNQSFGIQLYGGARSNIIGTNGDGSGDATEGNLISGNGSAVAVQGVGTDSNVVAGNLIGSNRTGNATLGQQGDSVWVVQGAKNNRIGTNSDGVSDTLERNVIVGGHWDGVAIFNDGTDGTVIAGNYIGVAADGVTALNTGTGVAFGYMYGNVGANGTRIIGNIIAGASNNAGVGIDPASHNSLITGNYIGTNAAGTAALPNVDGIEVSGYDNTISGNVISGNLRFGVWLTGSSATGNTVAGNLIGTNAAGTAALANGTGVYINSGAHDNVIGSNADGVNDAAERNLISGNTSDGLLMSDASTTNNIVAGNYISTDATGTSAIGNGSFGVELAGAVGNTIGGLAAAARNVISGGSRDGIGVTSYAASNVIEGNYIGVDASGMNRLGNALNGIWVGAGSNNLIGGAAAGAGNVISGSGRGNGVEIDSLSPSNTVEGNKIGTNAAGTAALPNAYQGVAIYSSANNRIGDAGAGNLISGNIQAGIYISGAGAASNVVAGNTIGTNAAGDAAIANGSYGVMLLAGAANNRIGTGGSNTDDGNLISGNSGGGIQIAGGGTNSNVVAGNCIGTNAAGAAALANGGSGVLIQNRAASNLVGTNGDGQADLAERNVISGNRGHGIDITGSSTNGNAVAGNYIGIDVTGTVAVPNGSTGIAIESGAAGNRIGTNGDGIDDAGERNVIAGNSGVGIVIQGTGTNQNVVAGNYLGTNAAGTAAIPSPGDLVLQFGASNNRIGTDGNGIADDAEGNVISGTSVFAQMWIQGVGTMHNIVAGNRIGTNAAGTAALSNRGFGVFVQTGAQGNIIGTNGDGDAAEGNLISGNALSGVVVYGAGTNGLSTTGNSIRGNSIHDNGGTGIDLGGLGLGGVTPNDPARPFPTAGTALQFDGTDDYATVPQNAAIQGIEQSDTVTAEAWINVHGWYNGWFSVFDKYDTATDFGWTMQINQTTGLEFTVRGATASSGFVPNLNQWYHVAVSYSRSAGTIQFFVNGLEVAQSSFTGDIPTTSGPLYLGYNPSGGDEYANGAVDDLRLWNVARTQAQIQSDMTQELTGTEAGLAGYWTFDEGSGTTFHDQTPNHNDGTLAGGASQPTWITSGAGLPPDADVGANNLQNYPALVAAHPGSSTRVVGTLDSTPNTTFTVDFYANATADPSGYGEGQRYLSAATVTTDANGVGSFDVTLNAASTAGEFISATATDPAGNTSEFSADIVDGAGPQVTNIAAVSPNPRNTPVDSVDVTFSEPIDTTTLDASDLALTIDGAPTLISGSLTVTPLSGTTYRISGLDSSTGANGAWTLTVNAGGIDDLAGNAGSGSDVTNWLMDNIAPVSQVNALTPRQSALTFTVSVSGNDPAPAGGVPVSGVITYDIFVSTDGGPFTLWTSVPAADPSADFTGQSRHTYGFYSIAHDGAGNVESKAGYNDAVTYVPDFTPPVTHIITDDPAYSWGPYFPAAIFGAVRASSYANGVFTLNWAGADPCQPVGGSIAALSVYEQIDGGTATLVGTVTPGSPAAVSYNGATYYVYSGSTTASALGDGQPHSYSFYSIGTDDLGLAQPVPPVGDVAFNGITYTAPLTAALAVEKGIAERSYVRYLDVVFNQSLPSSPALQALRGGLVGSSQAAYVELLWYGENLTAASTAKGSVNLFAASTAMLSLSGSVLAIDLGAGGVTSLLTENNVTATGSPRTTFGDGWYALGIDPYGDPSQGTVLWLPFFRLLGDVNGDGTVTGPATTAGTDANIVSQSRGQSGPLLNADVNGDGAVNTIDLQEVTIAANAHDAVGATPPSSFPEFQLLAGTAGTGAVSALTPAQLTALLPPAIAAWQAAGLSPAGVQAMQQVRVEVANLGSSILGEEYPGLIEINRTAAGHAWSLKGRPKPNQVDLLTVLEHELGHVAGLADNAQPGDLMNTTLAPGVRRAPTAADVHETVFALLAQEPLSRPGTTAAATELPAGLWSLPRRKHHR